MMITGISKTASPQIHSGRSTTAVMRDVLIALLPLAAAGCVLYGWRALLVLVVSTGSAVLTEYIYEKLLHQTVTSADLSAAVTGLLLGLSVTPLLPWWLAMLGSVFAVLLVKLLFGGIGRNFMNPALAARAFLLISFPRQMIQFMNPQAGAESLDLISGATPLPAAKWSGTVPSLLDSFLGNKAGSIGEVCILAIILGFAYLIVRRVIHWEVPLIYLAVFALFAWFWGADGWFTGNVLYQLLNGGVIFAAVFMVTDYTSTPMRRSGQWIFAAGAGFLTILIRRFGAYPEGVTFAILLMNLLTPLLDRALVPASFGRKKHAK